MDLTDSVRPVHGEFIVKPLREADRSLGSEFANGSISTLIAVWECLQLFQPAYHRRVSYGCDDGCNRLEVCKLSLQVKVIPE